MFVALSSFLALQDTPGLSSVLLASALELVISPRSFGFFYWRILLEIEVWVLDVLIGTGMLLLIGLLM